MNLGKRIRQIRESKGLTQEEIFKGIISNSHYSNIEKGRYTASIDTIKLIANRLDIPEGYLISVEEDCEETRYLLDNFRMLIDTGDVIETNKFLERSLDKLSYITSLKQESKFRLLTFLHMLNSDLDKDAMVLFSVYFQNGIQVELGSTYKEIYLYAAGLYNYKNNEHKMSIHLFKELLNIIERDSPYKPRLFYNIGMSLYSLFKYKEAIEYVKEAKILYLKLHEWDKVGDCYNILAVLNRETKNFLIAETYLEKGFKIVGQESFQLLAKLNHNSALLYYDQESYMSALQKVNLSIKIKKDNSLPGIFMSYKLKLNVLLHIDDIILLNQTFKSAERYIKTEFQKAQYLYLVAKKHYILGEPDTYEANIDKAVNILIKEKEWKELRKVAEDYSSFLEKNKRYKKSLELQKLCYDVMKNIYEGG